MTTEPQLDLLQIPPPRGICRECAGHVLRSKLRPNFVTAYCQHSQFGGWFLTTDKPLRWHMLGPLDVVEWQNYIDALVFTATALETTQGAKPS